MLLLSGLIRRHARCQHVWYSSKGFYLRSSVHLLCPPPPPASISVIGSEAFRISDSLCPIFSGVSLSRKNAAAAAADTAGQDGRQAYQSRRSRTKHFAASSSCNMVQYVVSPRSFCNKTTAEMQSDHKAESKPLVGPVSRSNTDMQQVTPHCPRNSCYLHAINNGCSGVSLLFIFNPRIYVQGGRQHIFSDEPARSKISEKNVLFLDTRAHDIDI